MIVLAIVAEKQINWRSVERYSGLVRCRRGNPCRASQTAGREGVRQPILGGIWRDGFEELNWVAPYDQLLPLGKRPTQFRQGDILQLPDPLPGHPEFLSNFFES